jgi:hypothetical protein
LIPIQRVVGLDVREKLDTMLSDFILKGVLLPGNSNNGELPSPKGEGFELRLKPI